MAIVKNTNTMMADTGGLSGGAGAAGKSTRTTASTQKNTNPTTTTQTKATTTTPKTTTTTTPKTTSTPQGTKTTVTHADGSVSTAYIVNGHTVDANGNAYQFKNGDKVKTAGGTYTVNNGVGTKNETTTNTANKTSTATVAKPSTTNNTSRTVKAYTDTGTKTAGTGNKTSTTGTKTVTTTTPKTTATSTPTTISSNVTGNANTTPKVKQEIPRYTDTATGTPYDELLAAKNALDAEKDELSSAKYLLDSAQQAAQNPTTGNDGANGSKPASVVGLAAAAVQEALKGNTQANGSDAGNDLTGGNGNGGNGGGGGGNTQPVNRSGVSSDTIAAGAGPAGSTPTTVYRNGQAIPAYLLNGRTVDANGNLFVFQNGDRVRTAGGEYEWNNGSASLVDGTAPAGSGNQSVVDPSNPPQYLASLPDNATRVPVYNPDGSFYGDGYVINGVTYMMNGDGSLSRLASTGYPLIVQTQGGDYVMGSDGKGYTLNDYVNKYGADSLPGLNGNGLAQSAAQGNASYVEQPGTARPTVDYSNMSEGDLINYIMNAINTGDEAALRDFMTWAEAESIARERMNPLYNQYLDQQMQNIDLKALQGGFYGQLPTEALRQQALAATEGDRTQAIIDYATQLLNADREGVLQEAELGLDERQQRINTLMNLLESNRALSEAEKDRELKKYIADQDSMNTQGKLQNDMEQFNRELEYKYWVPQYQYNTANVNKK